MDKLINCFKELQNNELTEAVANYFEGLSIKQLKDLIEITSVKDLTDLIACLLKLFEDFLKKLISNTAQDQDIKLLNSCCSLLQTIIEIHSENHVIFKITNLVMILFSMINCSCSNVSLTEFKDNILLLGHLWIIKRYYKYEKLVATTLFCYMNKCSKSGAKVLDYQRLCELKDSLIKLDSPPTPDQIRLIKACFSNEHLLSTVYGKHFLSALLSWRIDVTQQCQEAIKQTIINANIAKIKCYGEIYYLAWARPLQLSPAVIEMECLEYLVYGAIHVSRKVKKISNKQSSAHSNIPLHYKLRILIHSILKRRRTLKSIGDDTFKDDVLIPSLSTKLLDPILWKSLTVPNHDVRLNAAYIFFDTFPILDQTHGEANVLAPKLLKQYDLIKDLLKDPYHMVRSVAITGTCKIMAHHWNAIPSTIAYSFLKYIIKVCVWDLKCLENRIIALNSLTYLIIKNAASHRMLKMLLPSVEAIILENSEKLRIALINLLFAIKNSPSEHNLKFCDVVQIPLLVHQLGIEHETKKGSSAIVQRLAQLLYSTFLSTREINEPLQTRELVDKCIALSDINHENALIFYKECSEVSSLSPDDKLRTINVYWTCIHQICSNMASGSVIESLYEMEKIDDEQEDVIEPEEELEEGEVVIGQTALDDSLPYNNLKILLHLLAPTQILLASLETKVNQMESAENQLVTEHKREFDSELHDFAQKLKELHFFMAQTFNTIFEVLDNISLGIILIMIAGYIPMELIPTTRTRIYEKLLEETTTKLPSQQTLLDQCIIFTFYHWGDSTSIFKHAHLFLDKHTSNTASSSLTLNKKRKKKGKNIASSQPPPDLGLTLRILTQLQHLVTCLISYDDYTSLDPDVKTDLEKTKDYLRQLVKSFIEASENDQSLSPVLCANPQIMGIVYETYLKLLLYQHVAQITTSAVEITAVYPFAQPRGKVKVGRKDGRGRVQNDEVDVKKNMNDFVDTFVQLTGCHNSLIKMLRLQEGNRREDTIFEITSVCLRVINDALALNVLNRPQFEAICLVVYNLFSDIAWGLFPQTLVTLIHEMFRYCVRIRKALDPTINDSPKVGDIAAEGDSCQKVEKPTRRKKGGKTNVDEFFSTKSRDFDIMRQWVLNLYVHMIEACCHRSELLPQPSSEQLTEEKYHENLVFYPLWRELQQTCPGCDMMESLIESTLKFLTDYLIQYYRPRYPDYRADTNYLQIYTFPYLILQYFSCLSKAPFNTHFVENSLKAIRNENHLFNLDSLYTVLVIIQILAANFKSKLTLTEKKDLTSSIERRLMTTTIQDSQLLDEIKLMLIEL